MRATHTYITYSNNMHLILYLRLSIITCVVRVMHIHHKYGEGKSLNINTQIQDGNIYDRVVVTVKGMFMSLWQNTRVRHVTKLQFVNIAVEHRRPFTNTHTHICRIYFYPSCENIELFEEHRGCIRWYEMSRTRKGECIT